MSNASPSASQTDLPRLWPYLNEHERERLTALLQPRLTRYIPHQPHPKQALFLELDCQEALYGGAAGGGKTDALLMGALQYVDIPGYAALILMRTFSDLSLPKAGVSPSRQACAAKVAVEVSTISPIGSCSPTGRFPLTPLVGS